MAIMANTKNYTPENWNIYSGGKTPTTADAIRQASSAAGQPTTDSSWSMFGKRNTPTNTTTDPVTSTPVTTPTTTSTTGEAVSGSPTTPTTPTTPAATPTTPPAATPTTPPVDYVAQMKAALDAQLAATVGGYNTERQKIPGQVTSANNAASSQGMVNAQHIRDTLSQMGLLQSGESSSQQLANDMNTSNNVNANVLQGQQLDASYADKIALAQAQNALDYNDRSYQYGRDTVADTQWDRTFTQREAEFATTSAQQQQQINNQASQFAQTLGLSEKQLAAQIAQNGASNSIAAAGLAQSANQFAAQMDMNTKQYNAGMAQWALTYNAGLDQQEFDNGITVANTTGTYSGDVSSGTPRAVINADGTISIVPVALT